MISFHDFPEGDSGTFVIRKNISRESQVGALTKALGISNNFANELYDNGVLIDDKFATGNQGQISPLLDSWYRRNIVSPPSNHKDLEPNHPRRPMGDEERLILELISLRLCEIAPRKEPKLNSFIPVWTARNQKELHNILKKIELILNKTGGGGPHLLWFRGQDKEYKLKRSKAVVEYLGYPSSSEQEISLIPSLGRLAEKHSEVQTWEWAWGGPVHPWKKAFMLHYFLQNPKWFELRPGFLQKIEKALLIDDDHEMGTILNQIVIDPKIYTEADYCRQSFFAYYKYNSFPLILQHYGMPTSCLDITKNIDVALFFALHRFDANAGCYTELDKGSKPVIYLFAEASHYSGSDGTSVRASDHIMQYGIEPLPAPLRIIRQECGLLYGADIFGRNRYADLVIGKIYLEEFDEIPNVEKQSYLFPGPNEDELYGVLVRCRPRLPFLVSYEF